jgi:hypothetical protein
MVVVEAVDRVMVMSQVGWVWQWVVMVAVWEVTGEGHALWCRVGV